MSDSDFDFTLPDWDVPPPRSNQISQEAYLQWLEENRRELIRTGELEKIRKDPLRCPVDVRFVWKELESQEESIGDSPNGRNCSNGG